MFSSKTILIVGDLVADQYLSGTIARVSREAPVFILRHDETTTLPGAAANAAANIASLGGHPILVGTTGEDANGELLLAAIKQNGIDGSSVITDPRLRTTTKLRVLAGQTNAVPQQVIRIDYENTTDDLPSDIRDRLIRNISIAGERADAILISDYNYGIADDTVFRSLRDIALRKQIPIVVDSRFRLRNFPGVTAATPNQDEVEQILGKDISTDAIAALCRELGYDALLVTKGSNGMQLFVNGRDVVQIDVVGSPQPVDVTGAGDTVIAAFSLALASGFSFLEAANIANHAGGLVVMKKGTATVTSAELVASLESGPMALASKPNV